MHLNLIFAYCCASISGTLVFSLLKCRFLNYDFILVETIFCYFVKVIDVKSEEKINMVDNLIFEFKYMSMMYVIFIVMCYVMLFCLFMEDHIGQ